jgi:hypothetical protein
MDWDARVKPPKTPLWSQRNEQRLTTEDKGNVEVLTHSNLDFLCSGLCPFHLQGSGT